METNGYRRGTGSQSTGAGRRGSASGVSRMFHSLPQVQDHTPDCIRRERKVLEIKRLSGDKVAGGIERSRTGLAVARDSRCLSNPLWDQVRLRNHHPNVFYGQPRSAVYRHVP